MLKIEDLEKATIGQLREETNKYLAQTEAWNNQPYQIHFGNLARFYMDEIERRESGRISRRDFRMELIVIFLIALEIIISLGLGFSGMKQQTRDFKEQLAAFGQMQTELSTLQQSSQATADTLLALKAVTESMNAAAQGQLAVSYDPLVVVRFNGVHQLEVMNEGRTNVTLWGSSIAREAPVFLKNPSVMPPNGGYEFDGEALFQQLSQSYRQKGSVSVPYNVYMKNELGAKFVVNCTLTMIKDNLGERVVTQIDGISRRPWNNP